MVRCYYSLFLLALIPESGFINELERVGSYKEALWSLTIAGFTVEAFLLYLIVIVGNFERDLALPDLLYKVLEPILGDFWRNSCSLFSS